MLAETLLAANALAHVGANAGCWFAAGHVRVALGFQNRTPFVRVAQMNPALRTGDIDRLHLGYAAQLDPDALVASIVQGR